MLSLGEYTGLCAWKKKEEVHQSLVITDTLFNIIFKMLRIGVGVGVELCGAWKCSASLKTSVYSTEII